MEKRAKANQSVYDKLFGDIVEMNKENLTVDCCSKGNIFFDEKEGFWVIDAYPGNEIPNISYLIPLILGDLPDILCINNGQVIEKAVPKIYLEKYLLYCKLIVEKITNAVLKYGISFECNLQCYQPTIVDINSITELSCLEKTNIIRISTI